MSATLLIDGYNLLNATGLAGYGTGTALARARRALLDFLATTLDDSTRATTTIVFDAGDVPPHAECEFVHAAMQIYFARDFADADEMIETLIRSNHAPRRLTVISSDHRIQRAARRRRAKAVDSEPWFNQLWQQRRAAQGLGLTPARKPDQPPSDDELQMWLNFFGDEVLEASREIGEQIDTLLEEKTARGQGDSNSEAGEPNEAVLPPVKDGQPLDESLANPFPPGYGSDPFDFSLEEAAQDLVDEQPDPARGKRGDGNSSSS